MFTAEEIRIANATSRSNGATARGKDGVIKAIVPNFVYKNIDKHCSILDFGAGKDAIHTKWLKEQGFQNITAYDFGENCINGVHDANALNRQYDIIFASNVLNVNNSVNMLAKTIDQIFLCLAPGGAFICNYPSSPRKIAVSSDYIKEIIEFTFDNKVKLVGGTKTAPLWKIIKPLSNSKENSI